MIGPNSRDDAQNTVIVCLGVLQSLDDDRSDTIPATIYSDPLAQEIDPMAKEKVVSRHTSVCIVVISLAIASLRKELPSTETREDI